MPNCTYEEDVGRVRTIGNNVRQASVASTIQLLQTVDAVVDALGELQNTYREYEHMAREAAHNIKNCKPKQVIDPENAGCDILVAAEDALQVQAEVLRRGLASACADHELRGENKDAVVSEYERAIAATADLHNAMLDLRWAIMEHDADLSPTTGTFTDAKTLISHLRSP